jgi:hypothetical protein
LVIIAVYIYRRTQKSAEQELQATKKESEAQDAALQDEAEQDAPVEGMAVEDTAVEDTAVEYTAVEDTAVEDTAVEDTAVEYTAVEDRSIEDKPAENSSIEEKPSASVLTPEASPEISADVSADKPASHNTSADAGAQVSREPALTDANPLVADMPVTDIAMGTKAEISLAPVKGGWASDTFIQLVASFPTDGDVQSQHQGLSDVIGHCYKLRKQSDYCQYGANLADTYQALFAQLLKWQKAEKVPLEQKGVGFMQLTTLLNDTGQFDSAMSVCQQAIDYQLDDGTVTGFAGRLIRVEKAKAKAS